jgi:hypothetical protein
VKDTDDIVLAQERHAEHHLDAPLPQSRIRDGSRVDAIQPCGLPRHGDTSGETRADRNPHPLANLVLDATGRPRNQLAGVGIEHQHSGRVGVKNLAHPGQQLDEKVIDIKPRQLGVGERLQVLEAHRNGLITSAEGTRQTHQNRLPDLERVRLRLQPLGAIFRQPDGSVDLQSSDNDASSVAAAAR